MKILLKSRQVCTKLYANAYDCLYNQHVVTATIPQGNRLPSIHLYPKRLCQKRAKYKCSDVVVYVTPEPFDSSKNELGM